MTQVAAIMPFMADERIQSQIKLTRQSDASLDAVLTETGMTKVEMLSRVCAWFSMQPPMIQKLVLGLVDEELKPAAAKVLIQRLAEVDAKPHWPPDVHPKIEPPPKRK